MKIATPKRSAIRSLTIPAVETYLQRKGWTKTEGANHNVVIYRGSSDVEGNPLVVAVPARSDLIDANQRLAAVVRTIAATEAKSPQQLAEIIVSQLPAVQGRGLNIVGRQGIARTPAKAIAKKAGRQYGPQAQNTSNSSNTPH